MSMLTVQVERLRDRAAELRQGRWSDGADDAALMDDAADTIESLRDRLTETCRNVGFAPYFFECSECGQNHLRNAAYVDVPRYCPRCGRRVVG